MNNLGKLLIIFGVVIILVGAGLMIFSRFKIPFIGRLPGDIYIKKENFTFYFPITTSIIISIVLSFILYFFFRRH
ncbi:MAG: DUF2905 domain-containing protein [Candidatus Omnitrophota bacterium]|nr:MAG: DUF2905 domain-containing protein [Candidatus Omnitrophota bacterium]